MSLTKPYLLSAAFVGGAVLASIVYKFSKSKNVYDDDVQDLSLSAEKVQTIFQQINRKCSEAMANIQAYFQQAHQQGQISKEEMDHYLCVTFEKYLSEIQEEVFCQHETYEEEVEQSVHEHRDNEGVQSQIQKLKRLYKQFGGNVEEASSQKNEQLSHEELHKRAELMLLILHQQFQITYTHLKDLSDLKKQCRSDQEQNEMRNRCLYNIEREVQALFATHDLSPQEHCDELEKLTAHSNYKTRVDELQADFASKLEQLNLK